MREFTLFDLFVRNKKTSRNATACVYGDVRITFGEMCKHCDRLALELTAQEIGAGDRVAVLSMNHPGFFVLFGAISKIGAILVPLNWRLANDELAYILQDSHPKILFADDNHIVKAREIAEPNHIPVAKINRTIHSGEQLSDTTFERPQIKADAPVCIIYTAAVEGKPRGAVLSHTNLISANLQVIASMGLTANDVNLAMLPLFHITGMNMALAVMQLGGKNVIMEKFNEQETLELTEKERVSIWGSFPPILQRMVEQYKASSSDISSLQYAVGIDGPDNIVPFEELTGANFWILYGQSETSGFVTFSQASDKPGTAGKQGPLSNFILVDENDKEVASGETGEIVVRGPLVFQGYWRLDEVNAKTFRNGWHHTGDLGQLDEDGFLLYKGRKPEKELIKPGGENVYPAEVEAVILQHPEIEAVSVIGVPDPKFGEGVKAICVRQSGSAIDAKAIIEFVGSRIARYKKPGYVEFVDQLPMNGKTIDRVKVKELYGG
jgi:long-chain acyl-CoA synthetase